MILVPSLFRRGWEVDYSDLPLFEKGEAINMVVVMRKQRGGFRGRHLPVWYVDEQPVRPGHALRSCWPRK